MRKYQIAVLIIGIVILATVAAGFTIIGSPISQQTIRYDELRYNDFQQIKVQIENYYTSNGQLPQQLTDLNYNNLNLNDPLTKEPYQYEATGVDQYQLCTEFSTDAETFKKQATGSYWDIPINHTKGNYCVPLSIPEYAKPAVRTAPL